VFTQHFLIFFAIVINVEKLNIKVIGKQWHSRARILVYYDKIKKNKAEQKFTKNNKEYN
jgi:hypothetical protein